MKSHTIRKVKWSKQYIEGRKCTGWRGDLGEQTMCYLYSLNGTWRIHVCSLLMVLRAARRLHYRWDEKFKTAAKAKKAVTQFINDTAPKVHSCLFVEEDKMT